MMKVQRIEDVRAVFDPENRIRQLPVTENFFHEMDQAFPNFNRHILISQFAFTEPWPTWEIHPMGDEVVLLLEGDTDMVLANADGSESVLRVSSVGEYVVVPRGTWHTARPYEPTSMLFLTPGEGTINALEPGGNPV